MEHKLRKKIKKLFGWNVSKLDLLGSILDHEMENL